MLKKTIFILLTGLVVWRIALQLLAINAPHFLPYEPSFAGPHTLPILSPIKSLYSWGNFDGVHYMTIANVGYEGAALIQAFFPLYPLLVHSLFFLFYNSLLSGLFLNHVLLIALVFLWYRFFSQIFSTKTAFISLLLLFVFPTSFFFIALYTETLFLLLVLATFYTSHQKQWLLAGVCMALATATRLVGVFLIIAVLFEYFSLYRPPKEKSALVEYLKKHWKNLCFILLGFLGIGLYMLYLYKAYGDPLYFYTVQKEFGTGRETRIILLPQVIWRYLKILLTNTPDNLQYFAALQEFILSGLVAISLILATTKKYMIKHSWAIFSLGAFLLPTLTGTLSSMPRYILVIFPFFLVIAQLSTKNKWLFWIYVLSSMLLLMINVILFIQGYWVA